MQKRDLPGRGLQQHEAVVIDRTVPEVRVCRAGDFDEVAEKPTRQVNKMDTLVEQLPAPGALRLGAPLAGIADSTAVAVAGANEQQRAQRAGVDQPPGLLKGAVISMVKSDANPNIASGGKLRQTV